MCLGTKEHESIVSADLDAKDIHTALLLAGAEPGSPVKFQPKYSPASGSVIKVFVQFEEKGKKIKVPAQQWVRNIKSRKDLTPRLGFWRQLFRVQRLRPQGRACLCRQ